MRSPVRNSGDVNLLIAPHPDDIAYSVGGIIAKGILRPPLVGVTVFTRSDYSMYPKFGVSTAISKVTPGITFMNRRNRKLSTMETTRLRKKEDVKFFSEVGIPRVDLNLPDAPLRGFTNPMAYSLGHPVLEDPVSKVLASSLRRLLSNSKNPNLILPLDLAGHVDHLIVRETCTALGMDMSMSYYEDLPYAADLSLDDIQRQARSVDPNVQPRLFDIGDVIERKVTNLEFYRTQVGKVQVEKVIRHAKRLGSEGGFFERLWFAPSKHKTGNEKSFLLAE